MGFLAGFGESLNRSAELQQQAKLAQQQELTRANLKLAELYLGSPDPDDQAKGLAIMADPTVPFRTDKDHPKKKEAQNILQTLGGGAAGQGAAQGPPGMAAMLGADQSPYANMYVPGEGGPDQGGPQGAPMPPPPPLPPQPAAQTTAPPASMGGSLPPQAAMGGAPTPPPPPQVGPPPGPPAPPPQLAAAAAPPPPPDEIAAAIQAFQGAPPLPMPPLSHTAQQAYYAADLQRGQALQRAMALKAAGASPEEVRAVLAGREGTQVITTGMKGAVTQAEGEANRGSRERIAADRVKAIQAGVEARVAEAKTRREQDWAKHKESLSLGYSRLAAGQNRTAERAETARLTKLQAKGEEVRNFADNGISGIENLRGMHQLYAGADGPKEKIIAWERFADAAAGEAARITAAMTGMGVKGVRQTEARVRAAVKEITTTHKSLIPGYPPIPVLSPGEIDLRLDNIRHLVEDAERQARAGIEESAAKPPKPGESPLTPVPTRGRAGQGPPAPPQELQGGATPKEGDTKTFPNGRKARWDGKGWVQIQ